MCVRFEMCDRRDLCHKMYACVCEARPVWTGVTIGGAFVQDIHSVSDECEVLFSERPEVCTSGSRGQGWESRS